MTFLEQVVDQIVNQLVGIQERLDIGGPVHHVRGLGNAHVNQQLADRVSIGPGGVTVNFPARPSDQKEKEQGAGAPQFRRELLVAPAGGQPRLQVFLEVQRDPLGNPARLHHQTRHLRGVLDIRDELGHEPSEEVLEQPAADDVDAALRLHPNQEATDRVQPGIGAPGITRGVRVLHGLAEEVVFAPCPLPDDFEVGILQLVLPQSPPVQGQTPERVVDTVFGFHSPSSRSRLSSSPENCGHCASRQLPSQSGSPGRRRREYLPGPFSVEELSGPETPSHPRVLSCGIQDCPSGPRAIERCGGRQRIRPPS